MRRILLVLTFGIGIYTSLRAQVPGFMGKKMAIGYNLDVGFPIFRGPDWRGDFEVTSNYKGEEVSPVSLYPRHNITIEYVVAKQISIEASYGFSKSGLFTYETENGVLANEYPGISAEFDGPPYYSEKSYDYLRVNNRMFKIGVNLFTGHFIAPHGSYTNISYLHNSGTVQYVLNNQASDLARIRNHGFMITQGYRRILFSSLILDFGLGIGGAFGDKNEYDESTEYQNGQNVTINLTKTQTVALNNSLLLNGHVSIKYLLPQLKKNKVKSRGGTGS